ncbi:glucose-6-phosphate dehydrogenase [Mucisphaera calidilacus]|nr:glucose-6-phosphate dehydrogenase [Mucisphaera calidilacus]
MPTPTNQNCLLVIFGASGDLTKRKLIPALYALWRNGTLPESFAVVGIARSDYGDEAYRELLYDFNPSAYDEDASKWAEFSQRVHYLSADSTKAEAWPEIERRLCGLSQQYKTGDNVLFYLSLAPQFFEPVIRHIGQSGLVTEGRRYCSLTPERPWQRIVIEKPFGSDPGSAVKLNQVLAEVFDESAIYRIDHYLGKELVQNMMVLRFANSLFEPIWNQRYVDHVQITASETVGVEGRGSYYDSPAGGAMRDMVQSHLLQVLSIVAMEPPVSLAADDIRTEKIKIFKALRVPTASEVPEIAVRGQYGAGAVSGVSVPAYRDEDGVAADSQTDTFAAMKLKVDTWRWGSVPFYLRSGKAMAEKKTEIVVYLKPTPHVLFREQAQKLKANQILISIQPDEGIRLRFEGKVPGPGMQIKDVVMDFDYVKQWEASPPDGYATLLHDCIRGDQTLFKHRDEIECAWDAVQPVIDYWHNNPQDDLPNYNAGTWGPSASDIMMARDGRYWHNF